MECKRVTQSKDYGSIDMAKVFFTFCILAMHSGAFPGNFFPVFRLGVPFFFLTSSYFFFSKLGKAPEQRRQIVRSYIRRNAELYGVWFVLLLPITLLIRDWFDGSVVSGIWPFLRDLLLSSTFPVSWYITATIWGTLLVLFLSRYMGSTYCVLIGIPVYTVCCLFSNYGRLLDQSALLRQFCDGYLLLFTEPYNSVPAAVVWIALGRWFVQNPQAAWLSGKKSVCGLLASLCLYGAEIKLVNVFALRKADDCYLMLIPVTIFLFSLLLNTEIHIPKGKGMRKVCTLTFVTHASVIPCVSVILEKLGCDGAMLFQLNFAATLALCMLFSFLVCRLEKYPRFHWLRHLY